LGQIELEMVTTNALDAYSHMVKEPKRKSEGGTQAQRPLLRE